MDEAIAVLQQRGRDDRGPGRHPERASHRTRRAISLTGAIVQRPGDAQGQGRRLSIVVQVRHEARLQRLAGVARRGGAGEDADRAARVEPRARSRRRAQVRPGAARHLRRDGSRGRPRAVRRPTARKDMRLGGTRRHRRGAAGRTSSTRCCSRARAAPAIAAKPGYPTVIVPFAHRCPTAPARGVPGGFDAKPAPFGVSFTGIACSEPRLIALAYAFEQATKRRRPPVLD